jgi:phosphoribosylformylglycinamidine synthase
MAKSDYSLRWEEFAMQQCLWQLIKEGLIESAHDVSEGGLIVSLLESSFNRNRGFDVAQPENAIRNDAFWFGEAQGRAVITVKPEQESAMLTSLSKHNVPYLLIGTVTESGIAVQNENWGDVQNWKSIYEDAIAGLLKNQENEQALAAI